MVFSLRRGYANSDSPAEHFDVYFAVHPGVRMRRREHRNE